MSEAVLLTPALERPQLVAAPTLELLEAWKGDVSIDDICVGEIEPDVSDTAAMCDHYGYEMDNSANCVVVAGKREGVVRMAACVVLASTRADINGVVKKRLDVRKASFAPMDEAVALTQMEYGGITPFGLPAEWPVLVDSRVIDKLQAIFGSGLRRSKLFAPGAALLGLPSVEVIDGLATEVA